MVISERRWVRIAHSSKRLKKEHGNWTRKMDTTFPALQSGYQDQIDEAKTYLDKHKIPQIMEDITQALVFERPSTNSF
jgi:hypothetical protein